MTIEPQGIKGMLFGERVKRLIPEPTAEEVAKSELITKVSEIYEEACFADGNSPGFYYREYEDEGLLAVYKAGLEAGRQENN